jgi:hypothetical protein
LHRHFFFTCLELRRRRRRARDARRRTIGPGTNSAFFTVFFACAGIARAMRVAASMDARVAKTGVAGRVGVKLSVKNCARVVDSKKNRD